MENKRATAFLFSLLFFSHHAFALPSSCATGPKIKLPGIDQLADFTDANPVSPCPSEEETEKTRAKSDYQKNFPPSAQRTEREFNGLVLKGTEEEHQIMQRVLYGDASEKDLGKIYSGWPAVAKDCGTVECALTKLFSSEESAHHVLNIAHDTGYVVSANQHYRVDENGRSHEQIFSEIEVRRIAQATRMLPDNFKKMKTMQNFYRFPDGYSLAGHETAAAFATQGHIAFYKDSLSGDKKTALGTILHELGHEWDYSNENHPSGFWSHSKDFSSLSDWHEETVENENHQMVNVWKKDEKANFVSKYAETIVHEDFAESVREYFLDPETMKNTAPEKFDILKTKVFNQEDFISKNKWPEFEDALSEIGGVQKLIDDCNASIYKVDYSVKPEPLVWWAVNESSINGRNLNGYLDEGVCLKNAVNQISKKLVAGPDYCDRTEEKSLLDRLGDKVNFRLKNGIIKAGEAADALSIYPGESCFKKKDVSEECMKFDDLAIDPASANRFAKAEIQKKTAEKIAQATGGAQATMNCLDGISQIRTDGSGFTVYQSFSVNGMYAYGYRLDESSGCAKGIEKGMLTSGYKTGSVENSTALAKGVVTSQAVVPSLFSIEDKILKPYKTVMKKCDVAATKAKCDEDNLAALRPLVQSWSGSTDETLLKTWSKSFYTKIKL